MTTQTKFRSLVLSLLIGSAFAVAGCDGKAENAGEKIDKAVEKAGDKIDDAADKIGDAIDNATDKK